MDKNAEIFQSRSQKASYLLSLQEELLKHLMTCGCVNKKAPGLSVVSGSALTEGKHDLDAGL